jgi:FkbM family methyltransferase
MGDGPFLAKLPHSQASLVGGQVMTGLREIWVRDVYLENFLSIAPDAAVIDLGANMGMFSSLALGHGPNVKVVAVEADPVQCKRFERLMSANNWNSRVQLVNAFVGGETTFQSDLRGTGRVAAVPTVSQSDLLAKIGASPLHFLKCDIEGSEFALFAGDSPLLTAAKQIAIEIHPDSGNAAALIERIKAMGFEVRLDHRPPTINLLGRRR